MVLNPQNIQLVLYFDSDIRGELFWLCADLSSGDKKIQPTVFPVNQNVALTGDLLLAIIQWYNVAQVQFYNSFVTINASTTEDIETIGGEVMKVLLKAKIPVHRVGMISNYLFPSEKIDAIKNKIFNKSEMPESDFQYSRFSSKATKDFHNINIWKKYSVNVEATPDLLVETDINTSATEKLELNVELFKKFITLTNLENIRLLEVDNVL